MKAIGLEFYKLRHKKLIIMITLFIMAEIAWGLIAASMSISKNPNYADLEMLISLLSSLNSLFLPILSAICVSRICDMEHKGNTWKLLLTLSVKREQLYAAKYCCANIIMLYACSLQVVAIIIFSFAYHFKQPVPVGLCIRFLLGMIIVNMVIIAIQQWVSMVVKNQAFSLCLGMLGGFIGMTSALFPAGIRRILLWSYYMELCPVTLSFTNEKIQLILRDRKELQPAIISMFAIGIGLYLAGCVHVGRQEE